MGTVGLRPFGPSGWWRSILTFRGRLRGDGPADLSRRLFEDGSFRLILALKVLAVLLLAPVFQETRILPFMTEAAGFSSDPWTMRVGTGGNVAAFPYGPLMPILLMPAGLWAMIFSGSPLAGAGLRGCLLAADFALLLALAWRYPTNLHRLVRIYWASPIVFLVTYWTGHLDIIALALLTWGLVVLLTPERTQRGYFSRKARWSPAPAAFLGAGLMAFALAAQLTAALVLPFLGVLIIRNRRYRPLHRPAAVAVTGGILFALFVPWLIGSSGFRESLLSTHIIPDMSDMTLEFSRDHREFSLYVLPLLLLGFWYMFYRTRRPTAEFLLSSIGIAYLLVVSLTPAAPHWFVWIVPFVSIYGLAGPRTANVLLMVLNLLVALHVLLEGSGSQILGHASVVDALRGVPLSDGARDLLFSLRSATGLLLAASMYMGARFVHRDILLSRGPLSIGIAGDSGTGKDTLSSAIAGLFEVGATASVSGDDYHRFERGSPMWQSLTHLNPVANHLGPFSRDVLSLLAGDCIRCRHYDHTHGRFIPNMYIQGTEVILVSGLHGFYQHTLKERLSLTVFLDMDEELRRYFKIKRDVKKRQQTVEAIVSSIERRVPDFERYVKPQKEGADLILGLDPVQRSQLADPVGGPEQPSLQLRAHLSNSIPLENIASDFLTLGGVSISIEHAGPPGRPDLQTLIVADEALEPALMATLAKRHILYVEEVLGVWPKWQAGLLGVMQLLVLLQLFEKQQHMKR